MDSESAYWTLSTIGQATAALVGLVAIVVVFYMGQLVDLLKSVRPLAKIPILMGRSSRLAVRYLPVGMLVFGLALPMSSGIRVVLDSVNEIGHISANTTLNETTIGDIQSVIREFRSTMYTIVVFVPAWILLGYVFALWTEKMIENRPDYEKVEAAAREAVLNKITAFIAVKESAGGEPTDREVLREYDLGKKSEFFATLNSEVRSIVGGRYPHIRVRDSDIRRYLDIVLEERIIEWPQPKGV